MTTLEIRPEHAAVAAANLERAGLADRVHIMVVRAGKVADADSTDANVRGARAVIEAMGAHPRLAATVIQTVGSKGWDGFALGVVRGAAD